MGNCWSFQANPKHYLGAVLEAHNFYRAHHGSPPLVLDKKMCREASMQANLCAYYDMKLATSGGAGYSENIYVDSKNIKEHSPFEAVNAWYETIRDHDFEKWNEKSKEFCNMIWKSSKKLGVGVARTSRDAKSRRTFIVCQYDPPSKEDGDDFKWNVLRPVNQYEVPAGKIRDGPQAAYNPQKDLVPTFQGPQKGWGIDINNPASGKWKIFFEKNKWAAAGWKKYAETLKNTRSNGSAANNGSGDAAPANNGSSDGAATRRKRGGESAEDINLLKQEPIAPSSSDSIKILQSSHDPYRNIKRRSISPEVRRAAIKLPTPEFAFQQYYHNK